MGNVVYKNEHAFVEAIPQESGAVLFKARSYGFFEEMIRNHASWRPSEWHGWARPLWWWPWRRHSYTAACKRAIACVDAYARRREEAHFGLQQARGAVADLQAHADALASLNASLGDLR